MSRGDSSSRSSAAANWPSWTPENRRRANKHVLDALLALWDEYPDQRFGQLVMNVSREPGGFADTWNWSNGDWLRRIQQTYEEWK